MPDISARLAMPYILPAQAQKHVTHNEALVVLDALVQLVVQDIGTDTPPATPQEGQVWALGSAPTGDWAGHAGELAQFQNPGWGFYAPQTGWRAWNATGSALVVFDGTGWEVATGSQNLDGIGIQTSWDATNRLSLVSPASLFSHAGQGHQIKINKAGISDTASLLYQTNFTGHAEMGLAGNNDFAIKVSADGSAWSDAMVFDGAAGTVSGAAVQASATDTGAGKLARADYVYGPGNLVGTVSESGGVPGGAVIEQGSNAEGHYTRFADGTQICTRHFSQARHSHAWTFPVPFVDTANLVIAAMPIATGPRTATVAAGYTETDASILVWNTGGNSASNQVMATATGRWF